MSLPPYMLGGQQPPINSQQQQQPQLVNIPIGIQPQFIITNQIPPQNFAQNAFLQQNQQQYTHFNY